MSKLLVRLYLYGTGDKPHFSMWMSEAGNPEEGIGISLTSQAAWAQCKRTEYSGFDDEDELDVDGSKLIETINRVLREEWNAGRLKRKHE